MVLEGTNQLDFNAFLEFFLTETPVLELWKYTGALLEEMISALPEKFDNILLLENAQVQAADQAGAGKEEEGKKETGKPPVTRRRRVSGQLPKGLQILIYFDSKILAKVGNDQRERNTYGSLQ